MTISLIANDLDSCSKQSIKFKDKIKTPTPLSGTPKANSRYIQSNVQTSSEGQFFCRATYSDNTVIDSPVASLLVYGN